MSNMPIVGASMRSIKFILLILFYTNVLISSSSASNKYLFLSDRDNNGNVFPKNKIFEIKPNGDLINLQFEMKNLNKLRIN